MEKQEEKNQFYEGYFSARNITPLSYQNYQIPQWIMKFISDKFNSRILDIGCGFGQILYALKNKGYTDISGIDPSSEAVEHCRSLGLDVNECSIIDFLPTKKFDTVCMNHVLEHMPKESIIPTLAHIRKNILKEGGILLLSVPNAQSNTGCYWAYEDFTHNVLFTSGSIFFVLRKAGFQNMSFEDPDCTEYMHGLKKTVKRLLLTLYRINHSFWNKVTSSSYHKPSPEIFSYELKVAARY